MAGSRNFGRLRASLQLPRGSGDLLDHKTMQGKEEGEGDTGHVCKLYDQEPAKKEKAALRSGTGMLRQAASVSQGVVG